MESLIYHSIFTSIQGEGIFTGKLSLFLRLSGCNLNCSFCDTKYAVEIQYFKDWEKQPIDEIIKKITKLSDNKIKNLIITGGEPLLQIEGIKSLISILKNIFTTIEIETNGTISGKLLFENSVHFNVSVKLSNSGEKKDKRVIPKIIDEFNDYERTIFKFVVKDEKDVNEVIKLQSEFNIKHNKIYLMPMAETKPELEKTANNILKLALSNRFNFSDRLQLRYDIK